MKRAEIRLGISPVHGLAGEFTWSLTCGTRATVSYGRFSPHRAIMMMMMLMRKLLRCLRSHCFAYAARVLRFCGLFAVLQFLLPSSSRPLAGCVGVASSWTRPRSCCGPKRERSEVCTFCLNNELMLQFYALFHENSQLKCAEN